MAASCFLLAAAGSTCLADGGACASLATAAVFGFVFNFAYGWGPVAWVYCAEMFPTKHRSKAAGITTCSNWVGNTLVSFLPPVTLAPTPLTLALTLTLPHVSFLPPVTLTSTVTLTLNLTRTHFSFMPPLRALVPASHTANACLTQSPASRLAAARVS